MSKPLYCTLFFYKTLKLNPIYTFEEGVEEIGKCTLIAKKDYPPGERSINLTMKLGGTFIDIKAILLKS